jgi:phospholipid N-methyltransferase
MSDLVFLKGFLKNWREVGSPVPSSRHVAKRICRFIDFQRARTVVEIGAGTGVITHEILNSLRPDAKLIVFEVNHDFCEQLRAINDSRLIVHNASAFDMHQMLNEKADYVVSGIPIATLSKSEFTRLCSAVYEVLESAGGFIQLQLSLVSYGKLKRLFRDVNVGFTIRNTPPAFMYCCRNPVAERICA